MRATTALRSAGRRLRAFGLGGAVVLLTGVPAPARAEESPAPPRHLAPYGLDWIAYIDPADLPPSRMAVCAVDSGVAVTPDTPATSDAGPILARLATDGGSGEPQGTAPEQLHGTRMAAAMTAPQNDWGTIGVWPAGRVVSVRAMVNGETSLRAEAYRRGIQECYVARDRHPIAAISLSLSCACEFTDVERARLDEMVATAHQANMSVIAAAGNLAGPVRLPASHPGVVAVGAGTSQGALCDYASFDQTVAVLGPACPVDTADPLTGLPRSDEGGGSSTSSATVAGLAALLRTLRPDASRDTVEGWIRKTARQVDGRSVLDGEAAVRAAGLDAVVDRARNRMHAADPPPAPPSVGQPPGAPPAVAPRPRPQAPKVAVRWKSRRLRVSVHGLQPGTHVALSAEYLNEFRVTRRVRRRIRGSTFVRLARAPHRVRWRIHGAGGFSDEPLLGILYRGRNGRYA